MGRYAELRREWMAAVEQWKVSGVSGAEFCRRNGFCVRRFYAWRHRLGMSPSAGSGSFVPVSFAGRSDGCGIAVVVGEHVRLELSTGFDQDELLRVIGALSPC